MSSEPEYKLVYHAGIPGRGEFIRLFFEATGTPYHDTALEEGQDAVKPYSDGTFQGNGTSCHPAASRRRNR
jgi:glutathione S-transferase